MWIDPAGDRPGKLSAANGRRLGAVKEADLSTQIWLGFAANDFEVQSDDEKVALYNHGDWFGEPENEARIIQALPGKDAGSSTTSTTATSTSRASTRS